MDDIFIKTRCVRGNAIVKADKIEKIEENGRASGDGVDFAS